MNVTSATQTALQGIQRGMSGLENTTTEIASAEQANGTASRSVVEPLVEQVSHQNQIEASAQVVKAEDESLGKLIDEMA